MNLKTKFETVCEMYVEAFMRVGCFKLSDNYGIKSVLEGSYRTVRRLQEEVNELKAPTAAYGAQGEEITMFVVETIN